METHRNTSGIWKVTAELEEVPQKARLEIEKLSGVDLAGERIGILAFVDRPLNRGGTFVLVSRSGVAARTSGSSLLTSYLLTVETSGSSLLVRQEVRARRR